MRMYMYTVYAYVRVHIYIIIYISTALLGETRTFRKLSLIIKPWKYTEINKMLMLKDGHKMCWGNIYIYIYIYIFGTQKQPSRGAHMKAPNPPPPKKKYAEYSQENTHTEMRPQQSSHAALLKSHSNVGIPPQIYHINPPKHPPTRAPPKDCVHIYSKIQINLKQWFLRNFKNYLTCFSVSSSFDLTILKNKL